MSSGDASPKRKRKAADPVSEYESGSKANGDDKPGSGTSTKRKQASRVTKKDSQRIEAALAEIFTAPSMATAMVGDDWATAHFIEQGKELAKRITEVSERHPQLRSLCMRLLEGESIAVLIFAVAAYSIPPLLHWNIIPGPDGILGVPRMPKGQRRRRRRGKQQKTSEGTEWAEQQPTAQQQYEAEQRAAEAAEVAAERAETNGQGPGEVSTVDFNEEGPPVYTDQPLS